MQLCGTDLSVFPQINPLGLSLGLESTEAVVFHKYKYLMSKSERPCAQYALTYQCCVIVARDEPSGTSAASPLYSGARKFIGEASCSVRLESLTWCCCLVLGETHCAFIASKTEGEPKWRALRMNNSAYTHLRTPAEWAVNQQLRRESRSRIAPDDLHKAHEISCSNLSRIPGAFLFSLRQTLMLGCCFHFWIARNPRSI